MDKNITAEIKKGAGGCQGCIDTGAFSFVEKQNEKVVHLNVSGTVIRLCPKCIKEVRSMLFDFSE